jgi:helicase MOV-10
MAMRPRSNHPTLLKHAPVAVTRAQAMLIVVGDPSVLSLDPLWRSFLNYAYNSGGWRGLPASWDTHAPVDEKGGYDKAVRASAEVDMNDFTRMMEELTLANMEEQEDSDRDANVDRPWREVE